MKKIKVLSLVCMLGICGLFAGANSKKAAALGDKLTAGQMKGATVCDYKQASIKWDSVTEDKLFKLELKTPGIVNTSVTKVKSNSIGLLAIDFTMYDAKGNRMVYNRTETKEQLTGYWNIGLGAGTYYLNFQPRYGSLWCSGTTSNYKITFTPNNYTERELNNTGDAANLISTDVVITGFLGDGFSNISDTKDKGDYYKVLLQKGKAYRFVASGIDKSSQTCIKQVWDNKASIGGYGIAHPGEYFVASKTDYYYVGVYNYGNEQEKYNFMVQSVRVPIPVLAKVTKGKASFKANWNQVNCSGYQVQYSLKKNMSKAKTKTISGAKTINATIKKLKKKKKYYVRVRAYISVGKTKVYSGWSEIKNVKTK